MIGGVDVRIPAGPGVPAIEVAVQAIGQYWPSSVYEDGLTAERYDSIAQVPFGTVTELFAYRDSAAADLWDAEGAVPEARNTMIHLLRDPGELTIIVDEVDDQMTPILRSIRGRLEVNGPHSPDSCIPGFGPSHARGRV